jgi:glycosyltransferase involved in cell wall biosynthesis
MKILIVIPNFEPAWKYGGVMKSAVFLARGLHELGVSVTVYTMNTAGRGELLDVPVGEKVMLRGVGVYYFAPSIFRRRDFHSRDLITHMKETIADFDVVYISAMWQYVGVAAARVAIAHDVPFIVAPHGSFAEIKMQSKTFKKKVYVSLFLRQLLNRCHAIHFCSDYERRTFSVKHAKPHMIVPNAVDDFFVEAPAQADRAAEETGKATATTMAGAPWTLLTAGRPDPIKGFDLCIETLAILRDRGKNVHLKILGTAGSPYGKELQALAHRLGVLDAIKWRPFVTGSALIEEFLSTDAYISMGRDENFCIAASEALCLGLPVVCADTVGISELVDDHDMGRVSSSAPAEAAQAVEEVMGFTDTARARIRTQARQLFRKESVAQQFLDAWQEVSGS